MFNKTIFYLHFGNGDIFESREFVKAWMKLVPSKEYYYAHGKNPRILLDIPELKFTELTGAMNPRVQMSCISSSNDLLVNCWMGITGRYLLPGIGCTVERLYDMYNDMLAEKYKLPGEPTDYIPDIDYSVYSLLFVNEFVGSHPGEKIFIDNGLTQSLQAENFPMDEIILRVADNHKDKHFIITHPISTYRNNIYYTGDITKRMDFDLPEISYLSTFCSTLIGRNSGPHVHTQVKKNVMDENKKLLSFTYQPTGASFVVNTPVNIRKYWSGATDINTVTENIERVINE